MEYTLKDAPLNKNLIIKQIKYANELLGIRLANFGFIKGEKIEVLSRPTKHICLVCLRDVVYALDKTQCEQVVVYD